MNVKMKTAFYSLSAAAVATLCLSTAVSPAFASSGSSQQQAQKQNANRSFQHVYVIMMENEGAQQIIGNSNMPYVNSLATKDGYASNYFGVTHDSLANYVAFLTGSNWDTNSDDPSQTFDHTNLADQLEADHLSWKGYMESIPSVGYTGYWDNSATSLQTPTGALYANKHNPFTLMTDILKSPKRLQNVVPMTQLQKDLNSNHAPNFSFIAPNLINDMHGTPPYTLTDEQLAQAGDSTIKSLVQEITSSKSWKTSKSIIYITWDEAEYPDYGKVPDKATMDTFTAPGPDAPVRPSGITVDNGYTWTGGAYGGGKVPMIIVDNAATRHFTLNTWSDHYSLLRTIEQNWNLGFLGYASDAEQVKTLPVPGEPKN